MEQYDVVVWMDSDGDMMTKGFSQAGHDSLKSMSLEYIGEPIQVLCHPDEFLNHMGNLKVGLRSRDKSEVFRLAIPSKKHLH